MFLIQKSIWTNSAADTDSFCAVDNTVFFFFYISNSLISFYCQHFFLAKCRNKTSIHRKRLLMFRVTSSTCMLSVICFCPFEWESHLNCRNGKKTRGIPAKTLSSSPLCHNRIHSLHLPHVKWFSGWVSTGPEALPVSCWQPPLPPGEAKETNPLNNK